MANILRKLLKESPLLNNKNTDVTDKSTGQASCVDKRKSIANRVGNGEWLEIRWITERDVNWNY